MASIKKIFGSVSPRKQKCLEKLASEMIDGITFDPTLTDEEVDFVLLVLQSEITEWFKSGKENLCGEE